MLKEYVTLHQLYECARMGVLWLMPYKQLYCFYCLPVVIVYKDERMSAVYLLNVSFELLNVTVFALKIQRKVHCSQILIKSIGQVICG